MARKALNAGPCSSVRKSLMRQTACSLLVVLALVTGCQTAGTNISGIRNFARVDEVLYRGAQPTEAGIETLREKGIRTVIDLRDDANPRERGWVESRGLAYIHIPCDPARVEEGKLRTFLLAMETADKPIFVHCRKGRDRTGLGVAAYRMMNGWERQRAMSELYGYGHAWLFYPAIARYLQTFEADEFRSSELEAGG